MSGWRLAIRTTARVTAGTRKIRPTDRATLHIFDRIRRTLGFLARFSHLVVAVAILHLLATLKVLKPLPDSKNNQAEYD
jgi:hypothetical protein